MSNAKELFVGGGPDTANRKEMIRRIDSGEFEIVLMAPEALKSLLEDLTALESAVTGDDLTERIEAAAEEIATKADEGWPALRCDKCGSLELIRNVPEDGYDCRGCSNFTRTPDEVIGITKIDLEKLATAIIRLHLEVK